MVKKKESKFYNSMKSLFVSSLITGNFFIFYLLMKIYMECKSLCESIIFGLLVSCSIITTLIITKIWWDIAEGK